jgi:hypothetical protein
MDFTVGVDYNRFGYDLGGEPRFEIDSPPGSTSIAYVFAGLKLRTHPTPPTKLAHFYFLGGFGLYRLSDGSPASEALPEYASGAHVGAGVDIGHFLIESFYQVGFTDGRSWGHVPLRIGFSFDIGDVR